MIRRSRTVRSTAGRRAGLALLCAAAVVAPAAAIAADAATQPIAAETRPADAPPPVAAADAPDESFLAGQRRHRDQGMTPFADMADGGEVDVADLFRLSMRGDALELGTTARIGPEAERFRLRGTTAVCTVAVVTAPGNPADAAGRAAATSVTIHRHDSGVTNDAGLWATYVSAGGGGRYLSISGQSVLGRVTLSQNLPPPTLVPAPAPAVVGRGPAQQPVNLTVNEWRAGPQQRTVFRGSARTLPELRAKFPDEFRRHAVPVLRTVSDLGWLVPGPAEAYRVFDEIPADPAVAARLDALLPDLDADDYPARQAAAKRLADLGPAGVLAALRTDPNTLSGEQRGQLARLVAAHRRRDVPDPVAARSDPAFLTDCLEHEDAAVRRAAQAALAKVLNRPLAFDPDAPPDQRAAAADAARKLVLELDPAAATRSATQPAAADPQGQGLRGLPTPAR